LALGLGAGLGCARAGPRGPRVCGAVPRGAGAGVVVWAGRGGEAEDAGAGLVKAESTSGRGALARGDVAVGAVRGEGSFGTVFEGTLLRGRKEGRVVGGGAKGDAVILKRAKPRVQDARVALELELRLNEAAQGRAPGACAPFLGGIRVPEEEAGKKAPVQGEVGPGLTLVWAKEGTRTVDGYLRAAGGSRGGGLEQLALVLGVAGSSAEFRAAPVACELGVVRVLMKDVLESLAALHAGLVVHRDLKPENVLVVGGVGVGQAAASKKKSKCFRLIDLGSAACFATGTNVENDTRTLAYAPPEDTVVPAGSPGTKRAFSEWGADRFDTFSAGVLLVQASVPALRKGGAELTKFRDQLSACDYDLPAWRKAHPRASSSPVLDAAGGAGWDLASGLLSGVAIDPRTKAQGQGMDAKRFKKMREGRLSATSALAHEFFTFDIAENVDEDAQPSSGGLLKSLFGV